MSDIIYREILEEDIPQLAKIRASSSGSVEHWANRINNYHRGLANPQKALPSRVLYLASHDDQITGFIAGHLTTRFECEGELQWIDTIQNYRGKGIATTLFKMLGKWFIENKAYKICVDPGNLIARQFYKKNGAVNLNDHWMFWNDIKTVV